MNDLENYKPIIKDAITFDTMFKVIREEEARVNTALFNTANLYDSDSRTIDTKMQLIDPVKGNNFLCSGKIAEDLK